MTPPAPPPLLNPLSPVGPDPFPEEEKDEKDDSSELLGVVKLGVVYDESVVIDVGLLLLLLRPLSL